MRLTTSGQSRSARRSPGPVGKEREDPEQRQRRVEDKRAAEHAMRGAQSGINGGQGWRLFNRNRCVHALLRNVPPSEGGKGPCGFLLEAENSGF